MHRGLFAVQPGLTLCHESSPAFLLSEHGQTLVLVRVDQLDECLVCAALSSIIYPYEIVRQYLFNSYATAFKAHFGAKQGGPLVGVSAGVIFNQ